MYWETNIRQKLIDCGYEKIVKKAEQQAKNIKRIIKIKIARPDETTPEDQYVPEYTFSVSPNGAWSLLKTDLIF